LSFHVQNIKLAIATRSVHVNFYSGSPNIVSAGQADDLYKDPELWKSVPNYSVVPWNVSESGLEKFPKG
jgi:hypothetical protein